MRKKTQRNVFCIPRTLYFFLVVLGYIGSLAACGPILIVTPIKVETTKPLRASHKSEQVVEPTQDTTNPLPAPINFVPVGQARQIGDAAIFRAPTETSDSLAIATPLPIEAPAETPTDLPAPTDPPPSEPLPAVEQGVKVIFYLVDGMGRPEFENAHTPNIDKIRKEGVDFINAYSLRNSRSIAARLGVLYSKTSMDLPFQGDPGIINLDLKSPTLPHLLHNNDRTSSWIFNKPKFLSILYDVDEEPILPLYHTYYGDFNDQYVTDEAIQLINEEGLPDFLFVDLGDTDKNLHVFGCASPEHYAGIEWADQEIGRIEQALQKTEDQKIIRIVSADHGCHEGYIPGVGIGIHGDASIDDMEIPMIFAGPGIRQGETIYEEACLYDIAPTIVHAINEVGNETLDLPDQWRGLPLPIFPNMGPDALSYGGRCTPSDR